MKAMSVKVSERNVSALDLQVPPAMAVGKGPFRFSGQILSSELWSRPPCGTARLPALSPVQCPPQSPGESAGWLGGTLGVQGEQTRRAPAASNLLSVMNQQHEPGTARAPPGADTSTRPSFEENYPGSRLLKHNGSRGGLLAVETPSSFEAPAVPETDEAGF